MLKVELIDKERAYAEELATSASSVHGLDWQALEQRCRKSLDRPKVCYVDHQQIRNPKYLQQNRIRHSRELAARAHGGPRARCNAVCIVEDITTDWMTVLGQAWDIPADFFIQHLSNPEPECLWTERNKWNWDPTSDKSTAASEPYAHMNGIFEYPGYTNGPLNTGIASRHCLRGMAPEPIQSNTKISYCRVYPWLCKSE